MPICCRRKALIRRRPARRKHWAWKSPAHVAALGDERPVRTRSATRSARFWRGGGYAEYALAPTNCVLPLPAGARSWSMRRPCPKRFSRSGPISVDTRPAEARRERAGAWRLQRHRHRRDPDVRTRWATRFSPPPAAMRNARLCEQLGARRAINYADEDFVAVIEGSDGRQGRRCHSRHGRRRLCPAQHDGGGDLGPHRQYRLSGWRAARRRSQSDAAQAPVPGGDHLARPVGAEKGAIRDALAEKIWPLVGGGRIKPVVDRRFPLAKHRPPIAT